MPPFLSESLITVTEPCSNLLPATATPVPELLGVLESEPVITFIFPEFSMADAPSVLNQTPHAPALFVTTSILPVFLTVPPFSPVNRISIPSA
ncbi:TPA: hypothetical protein SIK18_003896 [Escherichia coli]|nr:hypothetical protein [Escherichia coli]